MRQINAILLEASDVGDPSSVMFSLTDDAREACSAAEVVFFEGRLVRSRLDTQTAKDVDE